MVNRVAAMDVGLNRSQLLHFLDFGELSFLFVGMPMLHPQEETFFIIIHHAVDFPVEIGEPLQLHHIELVHRDTADLRPRTVLERIVVKEFAAQEKRRREHSVHCT